jgi:YegS/Rv2252/BmrU family lipid kinase
MVPARFRDVALIYNPFSGRMRWRRQHDLAQATALLEAAGMRVTLLATPRPGSTTALAREQVERSRDLIIACGGDGTINEVVCGMAGSKVPLAILPAGTANVLAKELGLPRRIRGAVGYIPEGEMRRIALGRVGQRYFICVGGVGPDAHIVYRLDARAKLSLGLLSYWLEGFRHLFTYDFPWFGVEAEGACWRAVFAVVSRTRHYGGPIQITRRANLFSDEFELAVFTRRNRFKFLLYLAANWLGMLERFDDVRFLKTRRVRCLPVEATERIYVEVDGEQAGTLPCEFEVVPDALSLLVPGNSWPKTREAS